METKFNLRRKVSFLSILKWFALSTFIGAIVGIFNALFLKLLSRSIHLTNSYKYYYLLLPFALILVNHLANKVSPENKGFSTNAAIASINNKKPISFISSIKAFFLPIITIAAGGSAGKESPCADVGAGAASFVSKLFSLNANERRKLMICGVSAGFAGVFGVPISGAMFGLEVLSVGSVFYEVMFPAFIAGITSFQVTHKLGVEYVYHPLQLGALNIDSSLVHVFLAGIFFGLVSLLFIEILKLMKILFRYISIRFSAFWKCFLAGALIILITLLTSDIYLGLTMQRVDAILNGDNAATFGFVFKILTTSLTFAGGGVGGLITPIFFIGANAGYFFADIFGLNTITFAALGLVSILAGVANTPLAASIMAMELFGADIAPYAAVSCVVSFLITGQRTIFDKQRFHFDKNLSDDDDDTEEQTRPQLENTLRKRNFFLSMVRHLIPQDNSNTTAKKDNETSSAADIKPEQETKPQQSKPKNKFEAKQTLTETLFGHLFPKDELEEQQNKKPENKNKNK